MEKFNEYYKKILFDKTIENNQLEESINRLASIFQVPISKVNFKDTENDPVFGWNYYDESIIVNRKRLSEILSKRYASDKLHRFMDYALFYNLKCYFYMIHELHHSYQKNGEDIPEYLKYIYQKCFLYTNSNDSEGLIKLLLLLNKERIYQKYHDLFITEVNADLFTFKILMNLLEQGDIPNKEEIIAYFNREFIKRFRGSYTYDFSVSLCEEFFRTNIDTTVSKDFFVNISDQDKIMNGLHMEMKTLAKVQNIKDLDSIL